MDLPFDRVVLDDAGGTTSMTTHEFLAMPLDRRVHAVLRRSLRFSSRGEPVDPAVALRALRERAASGPLPTPATRSGIRVTWIDRDLVHVELLSGIEDAELAEHLRALARALDRGQVFSSICTADDLQFSATQARMQAEFLREHEGRLRAMCLAHAFVLPTTLPRFALASTLLQQRLPMPHAAFTSFDDAREWIEDFRRPFR